MRTILKYYIRLMVFLIPILFLPVVYDAFGLGKVVFLFLLTAVGLLLWLADFLINKREVIKSNKFLGLFLLLVSWGLVLFLKSSSGLMMRSFVNLTGFGMLVIMFVWMFLWLQVGDRGESEKQLNWLTVSGLLISIMSLVVFMIPVSKLPLSWPKSNPLVTFSEGWSLVGNLVGELTLILFLVVVWVKRLVEKLKKGLDLNDYFKEAIAVVFFGLVLALDIYKMIKLGWVYLDIKTSWVIATEVLKNSPIFGVGLGNFLTAFKIFRPASFNMTSFWSSSLVSPGLGILKFWIEMGTVGLIILILFVVNWLKMRGSKNFLIFGFWGLLFLFLPLNQVVVFLLVWVMTNSFGEAKEKRLMLRLGEKGFNLMPYLFGLVLLAVATFGSYWSVRVLMGDYFWKRAVLTAQKNNGVDTYNLQIKAIGMNPYMADYRAIYSQTNLVLAQNLLSSGDQISDDDKEKASTLVQQAVREAKAAVSLDGNNADYWSNLAMIYRGLVGMVDGAADWSVQAYQQAVALDPVNPLLKVDLGGLYYAAKSYEIAERTFEDAVADKNDYANAWYNWAYAAKQQNKLQVAVNRLTQALKLVPTDSGDYDKASEELTTWKKELDELNAKNKAPEETQENQPETLKTAEPLPTITEDQKVDVGNEEELAPPVEEVTPEVTPTIEVSPTPSL